jgi:hypothetical protein
VNASNTGKKSPGIVARAKPSHHGDQKTFCALLTTFVLWLPMAAGPFAGAWIVVKAIIGWGDLKQSEDAGRMRYSIALFGTMGSILWAVGWGIWGMPPPLVH